MQFQNLEFEIQQEQSNRLSATIEALLICLFATVSALFLPQIIFQYLMQNGNVSASQSELLSNFPAISYGLAALFFVYAIVGNIFRARRIRQLRQDLSLLSYSVSDDASDEAMLADLLAEVEAESKKKTTSKGSKKSVAKKSTTSAKQSTKSKKTKNSKK